MPIRTADLMDVVSRHGMDFPSMPSRQCPHSLLLKHVPVVCLENDHFGMIFEYCLEYEYTGCPMKRIVSNLVDQEDRATMRAALDQMRADDKFIFFGGWVLPGAYRQFWGDTLVPRSLDAPYDNIRIIESVFFTKNKHPPVSIPILVEMDPSGREATVSTYQPLFAQAFPKTNLLTGVIDDEAYQLERYNVAWQSFAGPPDLEPVGFVIDLPLVEVPVFKFANVKLAFQAYDYARGVAQAPPICSMKYTFMPEYEWIWPSGLESMRQHVVSRWEIRPTAGPGAGNGRLIAMRPRQGNMGYQVRRVEHEEPIFL